MIAYRNRTPRCPHGLAIGLVRCEACSGVWRPGKHSRTEPKPVGTRHTVVNNRGRVSHPEGAPKYGRAG